MRYKTPQALEIDYLQIFYNIYGLYSATYYGLDCWIVKSDKHQRQLILYFLL